MAGSQTTTAAIESPENLTHQRREWLLERIGWCAISLTLVVAILGGLGPGIFGKRQATSSDGSLRVSFRAVERYESPCEVEVEILRAPAQAMISLVVSRSLATNANLEQIVPPPTAVEPRGDRLVLTIPGSAMQDRGTVLYRFQHVRRRG